MNPRVLSIGTALPPNSYTQEELANILGYTGLARRIFVDSPIKKRHLWIDPNRVRTEQITWQMLCDGYQEGANALSLQAVKRCMEGYDLRDVGLIAFASTTGFQCPALSYQIAAALKMNEDIYHLNNIGGGCQGLAPAFRSVVDYVRATGKKALAISTEICSATFYPAPWRDLDVTIGNAIFADASSAVLVGPDDGKSHHPEIVDFESRFRGDLMHLLGYKWENGMLKVVLSRDVPKLVPPLVAQTVRVLLERNNLRVEEIPHWVFHSGGVSILDNLKKELGLGEEAVQWSRRSLEEYGNCSSATVGLAAEFLHATKPRGYCVVAVMGAGAAVDAALLRYG